MAKRLVLVAAWIVSLIGAAAWTRSQDRADRARALLTTQFVYVTGNDLAVAVSAGPDATGAIEGQLMIKRGGQWVPVKLTGPRSSQ